LDAGLDVGCSLVQQVLPLHDEWLLRLELNQRFVDSQCTGKGCPRWRMLLLGQLVSRSH
jgi:hypothetical protein